MAERNALPPLDTLFSESWSTFKKSALNLFIVNLIAIAIYIALFFAALVISLPFGVFSIFNAVTTKTFSIATLSSIGVIGIIFLVSIIISVIVGYAIQAANILIVGHYKTKQEIGPVIKKGFSYVWRIFLASIFTGFIIAGGYFLFIIPGIFFTIIFSFTFYEIVLNGKGVSSAMSRSSKIVLSNFWGILGRIVILNIALFVITLIPQFFLMAGDNQGISSIFSLLVLVINVCVGWYGICYLITLYKHASKGYEQDKGSNLLWPIVVGIVGWIIGIIILISVAFIAYMLITTSLEKTKQKKTYQIYEIESVFPSSASLQMGTPSAR
ncbi:MAG: hypothetical protein KBC00_00180 [Candidatus Levybacteria bacterium]|nr:hypothetical protein [Candidatus Levybacteria bacterium]MBP9815206.1 hypothetical protein [Candidatus Levybacteria bacterium]